MKFFMNKKYKNIIIGTKVLSWEYLLYERWI